MHPEMQYLTVLQRILDDGEESRDRTGVGTLRLVGETLKFNLADGFPLITTKRVWFRGLAVELLWMISGDFNIRPLVLQNVNIWNEWPFVHYLKRRGVDSAELKKHKPQVWESMLTAFVEQIAEDPDFAIRWGDLGPVYGSQWRHWQNSDGTEIDQLAQAVEQIHTNPDSRRIIVTAWNPSDIEAMQVSGLPPCHMTFQFFVVNGKLSLTMHQRSVDSFLGLPFNIASYALLLHMVAHITDMKPNELILFLGDTPLYLNHLDQVHIQLERMPFPFPELYFRRDIRHIDDFVYEDIVLQDYNHHPPIKGEIAI